MTGRQGSSDGSVKRSVDKKKQIHCKDCKVWGIKKISQDNGLCSECHHFRTTREQRQPDKYVIMCHLANLYKTNFDNFKYELLQIFIMIMNKKQTDQTYIPTITSDFITEIEEIYKQIIKKRKKNKRNNYREEWDKLLLPYISALVDDIMKNSSLFRMYLEEFMMAYIRRPPPPLIQSIIATSDQQSQSSQRLFDSFPMETQSASTPSDQSRNGSVKSQKKDTSLSIQSHSQEQRHPQGKGTKRKTSLPIQQQKLPKQTRSLRSTKRTRMNSDFDHFIFGNTSEPKPDIYYYFDNKWNKGTLERAPRSNITKGNIVIIPEGCRNVVKFHYEGNKLLVTDLKQSILPHQSSSIPSNRDLLDRLFIP